MIFLSLLMVFASAETPASFRISPEDLQAAGWMEVQVPTSYSSQWFGKRYRVAPPSVEVQSLGGARGKAQLVFLRGTSAKDTEQLWEELQKDLAPNEALGRRNGTIAWVISHNPEHVESVLGLTRPDRRASPAVDREWLNRDVPSQIPGLRFARELFWADLPDRETRAGGTPLRFVFQRAFELDQKGARLQTRTSEVTFWVPREKARTQELAARLRQARAENESVVWKPGAVAIVLSLNPEGAQILRQQLEKSGYRSD